MVHMRNGSRASSDPVRLHRSVESTVQRIVFCEAYQAAYWRHQHIVEHGEDHSGIDPSQNGSKHHPHLVCALKCARDKNSGSAENKADDDGPASGSTIAQDRRHSDYEKPGRQHQAK
jgi:hypothetical protein